MVRLLNELAPDHRSGVAIIAASNNDRDAKMAKMTERVEQYEALRNRKEHAMLAGSELSSSSKGATPIRDSTKKGATAAAKAAMAAARLDWQLVNRR